MATYEEISGLFHSSEMLNRVRVAAIVAAESIRSEDVGTANHANRLLWAADAFNSPEGMSRKMWMAVLAANKSLTVEQIINASDNAIQNNVNAVVDIFATGA